MQADNTRALRLLQEILLTEDRNKIQLLASELERLKLSLSDKEKLIATLEPAIADLLTKKIKDSKDEMANTLAPVMGAAIKRQISEAKETIIDALYPIIGSTIRKAVAEAMKNLAKTVNEKIDQAMRLRLFRKKIQAKISGLSAAEILLNESLPFQLHDIFYIHKDTGILLAHFYPDKQSLRANEELLSGMLTAIRAFSKSAFETKTERGLNVIEYDDLHIYLEDGRYAYLAVVMSGVAPPQFFGYIHTLESRCHQKFATELRDFSGDISPFSQVPAIISEVLGYNAEPGDVQATPSPMGRYIVYTVFLILLSFAVYAFWPESSPSQPIAKPSVENSHFKMSAFREFIKLAEPRISVLLDSIQIVAYDDLLFLEGSAPSETVALTIAKASAHFSGKSVIVDHLDFRSALHDYVSKISVYFKQNSTQIDSVYSALLLQLAKHLQASDFTLLMLNGYSDLSGTPEENIKISKKRADRVKQFLVANGIKAKKIKAIGFGSYGTEPDNSKAGQAAKRCVTFEVY